VPESGGARYADTRERALLEAIPDYMFRIAGDGTYLDFHAQQSNEVLEDRDRFLGSNVRDHFPPDVAEELLGVIGRVLSTGETGTYENAVEHEGEWRAFESRIVKSGDDEVVTIVRDITDRKAAEEELRRSRARIVAAADAERRRLERNLHDGAQQRLVSLSLTLARAAMKVESDARELLDEATRELAAALAELRELARGIHPAILSDRGLRAALEALADRAPLPVEVEVAADMPLPEAVEVAVYYLASEALTNVAKYAHASAASVSVSRRDRRVVVVISDDGVGGADSGAGSGLRGLGDRIAALDGTLLVDSAPGRGTTIRAEVPIDRAGANDRTPSPGAASS
jgi:PAS domain S-box-containing protein